MFLSQTVIHWKFWWVQNYSFAMCKETFFVKTLNFTLTLISWKKNLSYFSSFYKDILKLWSKYSTFPLRIVSQYLWFNSFIKIDNKVVFHRKYDLLKENGKFKTQEEIKNSLIFLNINLINLKLIRICISNGFN